MGAHQSHRFEARVDEGLRGVNLQGEPQILALADDAKRISRPPVALPFPVQTRAQNPRLNRVKSLQPPYAETFPPKRIL